MNNILTITSGKGGVGKTTIATNLAVSMSKMGKKVLIFDADTSLANVDLYFGVKPEKTILDFVEGRASIQEIVINVYRNVYLIPSMSGLSALSDLTSMQRSGLRNAIYSMNRYFDYVLVDTASGISCETSDYISSGGDVMIVLNNDILSLTDSFATMKALYKLKSNRTFLIVGNKMSNTEYNKVFNRLSLTATTFLGNIELRKIGNIPFNLDFQKYLNIQKPLVASDTGMANMFYNIISELNNEDISISYKSRIYG